MQDIIATILEEGIRQLEIRSSRLPCDEIVTYSNGVIELGHHVDLIPSILQQLPSTVKELSMLIGEKELTSINKMMISNSVTMFKVNDDIKITSGARGCGGTEIRHEWTDRHEWTHRHEGWESELLPFIMCSPDTGVNLINAPGYITCFENDVESGIETLVCSQVRLISRTEPVIGEMIPKCRQVLLPKFVCLEELTLFDDTLSVDAISLLPNLRELKVKALLSLDDGTVDIRQLSSFEGELVHASNLSDHITVHTKTMDKLNITSSSEVEQIIHNDSTDDIIGIIMKS